MSNLIITVIAIGLVTVASLIGVYYGSSSYLNHKYAANASAILNGAQQLAGAWAAYKADHTVLQPDAHGRIPSNLPADYSNLAGSYIKTLPLYPAEAGGVPSALYVIAQIGNGWYAFADAGAPSGTSASASDPNNQTCVTVVAQALNMVNAQSSLTGNPCAVNQSDTTSSTNITLTTTTSCNGSVGNGTTVTMSVSPMSLASLVTGTYTANGTTFTNGTAYYGCGVVTSETGVGTILPYNGVTPVVSGYNGHYLVYYRLG